MANKKCSKKIVVVVRSANKETTTYNKNTPMHTETDVLESFNEYKQSMESLNDY